MEREILFRGKRVDNGEWVEGCVFSDGMINSNRKFVGEIVIEDYKGTACDEFIVTGTDFYEVKPETICQYTGLTDKNGKKIYEGDIVSAHFDEQYPENITYAQITWNGFSWCTRESTENYVMDEYDCQVFEVCGNIFDNPGLLNEE